MATTTAADTRQTLASDGGTRTNNTRAQSDPFYQSTPQTPALASSAVMPAVQQVGAQPPLPRQSRQFAPPRTKVPTCSHTAMARVYGTAICHNCGRVPSMGWLYSCIQDITPAVHHLSVSESIEALPAVADSGSYFEAQAQTAASIGMSASVVKQMRTGAYTYDQIETLLAQRRHVLETIRRTKNPSTASVPPTPKSATRSGKAPEDIIASVGAQPAPAAQSLNPTTYPMAPAGNPFDIPTDSPASTSNVIAPRPVVSSPPVRLSQQSATCNYQACHACRPYFQDRVARSFVPALDEAQPLADKDFATRPVHDATIVGNLGLRRQHQPPALRRSEESMDITMQQRNGNGYDSFAQDTNSDWTPTDTTSSDADSDLSREFDLSPCPGPGLCPVWTPGQGCAYDCGFQDGKRELNHSCSREDHRPARGLGISGTESETPDTTGSPTSTPSKGSSISLPNPPTTPLTPSTLSTYSLPDRSSPISNKSNNSSSGSEVEVAGGVALTEEAVKAGLPDIAVG